MLLEGRKLLVTGVLTESSIAFSVARRAQEEGAEIVLTGFGRGLRITSRMARRLPTEPEVLELDVNDPEQLEAIAAELDDRWGRLDGLVHAIAFVPADALGGNFLTAPSRVGDRRVPDERVLAQGAGRRAARPARARAGAGRRGRRPGLRRAAWRGRRTTGPACPRRRSRRSTATWPATSARAASARTSSPPARCTRWPRAASRASTGWPRRGSARRRWAGTCATPSRWPTPALFLLSPLARAVTGEILHVDGGYHALGAPGGQLAAAGSAAAAQDAGADSGASAAPRRPPRPTPRRRTPRRRPGASRPRATTARPARGSTRSRRRGRARARARCGARPWPAAPARRSAARCRPARCPCCWSRAIRASARSTKRSM